MRVSVVVPVYNTGRYIHDLLDSLRAQTLPADQFEVLLVDDGSTDGTPEVLDAAAAETPNLRVIHTPNSGWPGRPRNLGIDAALGDYVFLSDHDDRLDPDALLRLTRFAEEHRSDVVVGRIVGVGRRAPERIFARTVVDAQEEPGLLMSSLTPQKLYRRAFLNDAGIRFPEGRRRLEDHLFVTKAYLRAKRVSIYADHPVYYFVLRGDGQNASRRAAEWRGYYENVAESIAVVDAEAPDEATRVAMRSRWLRTEAINRLHGQRFLERDDRGKLLEAVADLVQRYYSLEEVDLLSARGRFVGRLLLDDRVADVVAFAEWEAALSARPEITGVIADPQSGRLDLTLEAAPHAPAPLPPSLRGLPPGYPTVEQLERSIRLTTGATMGVRLRRPAGSAAVQVPLQQAVQDGVLRATGGLDTRLLTEGTWRVRASMPGGGRPAEPALTGTAQQQPEGRTAGRQPRRLTLTETAEHRLVLTVVEPGVRATLRRRVRGLRRALGRARRAVRRRVRPR